MKVGTFDFETYGGFNHKTKTETVNPLCCAIVVWNEDWTQDETAFVHYRDCAESSVEAAVFAHMFGRPDVEQWWAHNAGNFDGLLLHAKARGLGIRTEAVLAGGNRVICFIFVRKDGAAVKIFDTFALAPSSLKDLAVDFNLPSKQFKSADYAGDMRDLPFDKLRDGCIQDAVIVGELLRVLTTHFEEWGGKRRATFSSSALSIVRHHLKDKGKKLPRLNATLNNQLRHACFGGRVEVFHHNPGATVDYDINSSYPASMSGMLPTEFVSCADREIRLPSDRYYRLRKVQVEIRSDCEIPVLPVRPAVNSGIYFPTGRLAGIYTDDELDYAESVGAAKILKVERTWLFRQESLFGEFIRDVYALKQTATGAKRVFTKYVLNGCYGKFGEKPEHYKLMTFATKADAEFWAMKNPGKLTHLDDEGTVSVEKFEYAPHTHFPIAATILARSRVSLHRHLCSASSVSYCDTDSVRCAVYPGVVETAALGGIKSVIRAAKTLNYAPKIYAMFDGNGAILRDEKGKPMIACKGFPVNEQSFLEMVQQKAVMTHRINKLKSQVRTSPTAATGINVAKRWSGLSMKRKPFPDGATRPWTMDELLAGEHKTARCPLL